MPDMSVEQATELLRNFHYRVTVGWKLPYEPDDYGMHTIYDEDIKAIWVVLDELKEREGE